MSDTRFNIRVYGIVLNDQNELLVSDERYKGERFTKFPGGGLEWGEGLIDCLHREFREELNQEVNVVSHYYTTDFFQQSAFQKKDQLITVYYLVDLIGKAQFSAKKIPYDFPDGKQDNIQVQRWISLNKLSEENFRWPVDKRVAAMLIRQFRSSN